MGREDDDDDQKFDQRILIASIFFFLTVALLMFFLHFYFKYLSRRREIRRRAALNSLINRQIAPDILTDLNSISEPPKTGLEPAVMESLPAFKFKADHDLEEGEITECSVCLGGIVEDDMVRVLPNCKHMFHNECIDAWFKSNVTCPICRTVVEPMMVQPVEKKIGGGEVQPSAPPIEESVSHSGGGSGFRFGSFRWVVGSGRSSTVRSCEDEIIGNQDLERH